MCAKVLIVDDEKNIVDILKANLEREGYQTITAFDGAQALEMGLTQNPDLILLDCMLPKMDGFDVCRKLRQQTTVPILMLTAKSEEIDKVDQLLNQVDADKCQGDPSPAKTLKEFIHAYTDRQ